MISEAARHALTLRKKISKASLAKLETILNTAGPQDRLRFGYKFFGAHTGRWSAGGNDSPTAQLQNFPRGSIKDVEGATAAIMGMRDLSQFGNPLDVISSCLRSGFRAPKGFKFVVADLSQIELRVLAWVSNCGSLADDLATGDVYKAFGARMYHTTFDQITKSQRQIAKPAVLGCGYQLSGGEIKEDKNGDEYKSGLWGYAEGMGIDMSQQQAHDTVQLYREIYPEVVKYWYLCNQAAIESVALHSPKTLGRVFFNCPNTANLYIGLPCGRPMNYPSPVLQEGNYGRKQLSYMGMYLGRWCRRRTYGGHLTENIVQGIGRDVLGDGMLNADATGFNIVGHSHDEIITLQPEDSPLGLPQLIEAMTRQLSWAPDLKLDADGWEGDIYRK